MADTPPSTSAPSPEPDKPPVSSKSGVHLGAHGDVTISGDVAGGDIIKTVINFIYGGSDEVRNRRNQLILLEKVKNFWVNGVLEKSVYGAALIELGMQTQPDAVEHPWDMVLEVPDKESRTLPPGKPIVEIFYETNCALLILGMPGSGKTTTLLELTRALIARAERNPAEPIPVVFNLSSWAERRQQIYDWLVEELNTKYQIPPKTGRTWLETNDILPLLDGLDEVRLDHRTACIDAINVFREKQGGLAGMVVCSRAEEYHATRTQLKLAGAVLLQPLTTEQIDNWLTQAGRKLMAVRTAIQSDAGFQELAQSPLMLSVMAMAYDGLPMERIVSEKTIEAQRQHLFDNYISRMLKRRGDNRRYSSDLTMRWLTWLARSMKRYSQSVFFVERLQPSWLPTLLQQRAVTVGSAIISGIAGVPVLGLVIGLLFGTTIGLAAGLVTGPFFATVFGLVIGLVSFSKEIRPVELLTWSWSGMIVGLGLGLGLGVFFGLLFGLLFGLSVGLVFGLSVGLFFGLGAGLFFGPRMGKLAVRTVPNEGIHRSMRSALVAGLGNGIGLAMIFGVARELAGGLGIGPLAGLLFGLSIGLAAALFGGLRNGGVACIQHIILRALLWRNGSAPLNYVPFLDYCADRILLRKVGGGYIFIHQLLQDYFAKLEPKGRT